AGCVERAEPRTLSSRRVARPSQYVLEVPAGWCERVGVRPGAVVRAEGLKGLDVGED
ncbi:MAG: DUF192 domain-containing protein, partial [Archangium sp.]|nr:DUF192 domain-containing protein [Archangium sp.]